jgi:hypothetical protein
MALSFSTSKKYITAGDLVKRSIIGPLKKEIDEIYADIQRTIMDSHARGESSIVYELPDTFETNSLEKKDIQLVIYSEVLEKLDESDFNVRAEIKLTGETFLYISWPCVLNEEERSRRARIISRHLRK